MRAKADQAQTTANILLSNGPTQCDIQTYQESPHRYTARNVQRHEPEVLQHAVDNVYRQQPNERHQETSLQREKSPPSRNVESGSVRSGRTKLTKRLPIEANDYQDGESTNNQPRSHRTVTNIADREDIEQRRRREIRFTDLSLNLRYVCGNAVRQTKNNPRPLKSRQAHKGSGLKGRVYLNIRIGKPEAVGENADHVDPPTIESHKFVAQLCVAVELFTPDSIAENDAIRARCVIVVEGLTEKRLGSEKLKYLRSYPCAQHILLACRPVNHARAPRIGCGAGYQRIVGPIHCGVPQ